VSRGRNCYRALPGWEMNRIVCPSADAPFPLSSQALFSFPSLCLTLRPFGDQQGTRQIGDGSLMFLCHAASPSPFLWACTAKQKIAMNVGQSQNGLGMSAWHRFRPLNGHEISSFVQCGGIFTGVYGPGMAPPPCVWPGEAHNHPSRVVLRAQAAGFRGQAATEARFPGPCRNPRSPGDSFR
jgi:hypothetical protein